MEQHTTINLLRNTGEHDTIYVNKLSITGYSLIMKKWSRNQYIAFYYNPFILTATRMEAVFRLLMLCSLGLMMISFSLIFIGISTIIQNGVFNVIYIIMGPQLFLVLVSIGCAISNVRGRKMIQKLEYKLCNHCRYNLNNLGNSSRCPECGNDYEISNLQGYWKSCYGEKRTATNKSSRSHFTYFKKRATEVETLLARVSWGSAIVVLLLIFMTPNSMGTLKFILVGSLFSMMIVLQVLYRIARRNAREKIRSEDYLLCNNCCYSLGGLPEEAMCPECGNDYKISEVQEYWKQCYNEPSNI